jgi:2-succinyl-5-enolpyruvyl-6-hydroxy-3-cyclohexene-1-carboxylate synthase
MTLISEKTLIQILSSSIKCGVTDFCICPGARNAPFIPLLKHQKNLTIYYFYDERSAGFFALGKSRAQHRPVAVITTSGTAISHLLPAAMEGYYTGIPLLFITADRPRSHRECNTPQSCEQVNIYGLYTPFKIDLEEGEPCDLSQWNQQAPAHVNICIEESSITEQQNDILPNVEAPFDFAKKSTPSSLSEISQALQAFLSTVKYPLVVVNSIKYAARIPIMQFLMKLGAPVFLEGPSGLREEPCLRELQITNTENIWKHSSQAGYPIDGALRIGGVPTFRFWRDLENKQGQIKVFSINEIPFSGISWGGIYCISLSNFFTHFHPPISYPKNPATYWLKQDREFQIKLSLLFEQEPLAEPSLIHRLSQKIPENSMVYLGNSLPIREWDLAATLEKKHTLIYANRGLNGIDGQTSTFLGLAQSRLENWAILGDLTTLHDLSAPWIIPQLGIRSLQIVVINNGGGKIFARLFSEPEVQNNHSIGFSSFASLWNLDYEQWKEIPSKIIYNHPRIIELIPDNNATERFWNKFNGL